MHDVAVMRFMTVEVLPTAGLCNQAHTARHMQHVPGCMSTYVCMQLLPGPGLLLSITGVLLIRHLDLRTTAIATFNPKTFHERVHNISAIKRIDWIYFNGYLVSALPVFHGTHCSCNMGMTIAKQKAISIYS